MKILVDYMPNKSSECPYSVKYDEDNVFCNYRNSDVNPRCNLNNKVCKWFREKRGNENE